MKFIRKVWNSLSLCFNDYMESYDMDHAEKTEHLDRDPWTHTCYSLTELKCLNSFPFCSFFYCSNPRLDIKWSRLHRPYRHYGHRSHRLRNLNHMNVNMNMNNLRLLNDNAPLTPADHFQYQASTDQYDLNVVSMSNNNSNNNNSRNHRKRHAQYRMKRDLNSSNINSSDGKSSGHQTISSTQRKQLVARIK